MLVFARRILILDDKPPYYGLDKVDRSVLDLQVKLVYKYCVQISTYDYSQLEARPHLLIWLPYNKVLKAWLNILFLRWRELVGSAHMLEAKARKKPKIFPGVIRVHRVLETPSCPLFTHPKLIAWSRTQLLRHNWLYYNRFGWEADATLMSEDWPNIEVAWNFDRTVLPPAGTPVAWETKLPYRPYVKGG